MSRGYLCTLGDNNHCPRGGWPPPSRREEDCIPRRAREAREKVGLKGPEVEMGPYPQLQQRQDDVGNDAGPHRERQRETERGAEANLGKEDDPGEGL